MSGDDVAARPVFEYTSDGLRGVLAALGAELRRDVRDDNEMMRGLVSEGWQPFTSYARAFLLTRAAESFRRDGRNARPWKPTRADADLLLAAHFQEHTVDTFNEFLLGVERDVEAGLLEPLDPGLLLGSLFAHSAAVSKVHGEALEWAGRAMLERAVSRTRNPGELQRPVPVLVGDPNMGKTTLPRLLSVRREWCDEGLKLNAEKKLDNAKVMSKSVIAVCDEMDGLHGLSIDTAKAVLTGTQDTFVGKWERNASTTLRRAAVVGTCNHQRVLPWDKGLADRLMLVVLPERPVRALEEILSGDVVRRFWAGALANVAAGRPLVLSEECRRYGDDLYLSHLNAAGRDRRAEESVDVVMSGAADLDGGPLEGMLRFGDAPEAAPVEVPSGGCPVGLHPDPRWCRSSCFSEIGGTSGWEGAWADSYSGDAEDTDVGHS